MKAIVYSRYGPPEVLQLKDVEKPTPKPDQVLIRIQATSVTAADYRMRAFRVPSKLFWLPTRLIMGVFKPRYSILGADFSGEIEAVGQQVTRYREGDRVFGCSPSFGTYAEYTCLPENGSFVLKPDAIPDESAAAVSFGMLTALYFLRDTAKVISGQKVLVYGASGAVGTASVQFAKVLGAEVTAVCSESNMELMKSLGADRVIDYAAENFASIGETWNVIFDTVGKTTFARCKDSLTSEGIYMTTVFGARELRQMLWTSIVGGRKVKCGVVGNAREDVLYIRDLVESGQVKVVIDRRYPLEQIVEAHRYADQGHKKGNIVIAV